MPLRDSTVTAAAGTPDTLRRGGPTLIYGSTGHTIMSDGRLHHFTLFVFMIILPLFSFFIIFLSCVIFWRQWAGS
jgi:hypothetical protein